MGSMQTRMVCVKTLGKSWPEKMAVGLQIPKDVPGACADLAIRSVQKDVD